MMIVLLGEKDLVVNPSLRGVKSGLRMNYAEERLMHFRRLTGLGTGMEANEEQARN